MKKMGIKCIVTILIFALVIIPSACKAPAAFEVTSLNITPTEAGLGELVTVTAVVENIGDVEGTYAALLTVDGIEVKRQEIWLDPKMTRTVAFDIGEEEASDYNVEVGGWSAVLTVKKGFYRNNTYSFSLSYPTSWTWPIPT